MAMVRKCRPNGQFRAGAAGPGGLVISHAAAGCTGGKRWKTGQGPPFCIRNRLLNNEIAVPAPPPTNPAPHATPPGGRLARMVVVLCFAITALATALIYWRWVNVTEPSSYVIIEGDPDYNGTVVTVSPPPEQGGEVVMATLSPDNQYAVTIFLNPGKYQLTAAQAGTTLLSTDLWVVHRHWYTLQLKPHNHTPHDTPATAALK